jgi:hypothetical protein
MSDLNFESMFFSDEEYEDFTFVSLDCDVTNPDKFWENVLKVYEKWETKYPEKFKDFRPFILEDNEIKKNYNFFRAWMNNAFLLYSYSEELKYDFPEIGKNIPPNWPQLDDEDVAKFTNELLLSIGKSAELDLEFNYYSDEEDDEEEEDDFGMPQNEYRLSISAIGNSEIAKYYFQEVDRD